MAGSRFSAYARRASRGRHARRAGASLDGVMGNWGDSVVTRREAERQLERAGERALDLYTNDAMAHGVLESLLVEAVGIGLTPQPSPRTAWLDLPPEWEADFQNASLRAWEEWGLDCRNWCDAARRLDFPLQDVSRRLNISSCSAGVSGAPLRRMVFSNSSVSPAGGGCREATAAARIFVRNVND